MLSNGSDLLYGQQGHDTLYGGASDGDLGASGSAYPVITWQNGDVCGGPDWDYLWGGTGDDALYGQGGKDYMHGGEGNDMLYWGAGDDKLRGGPLEDTCDGETGVDNGNETCEVSIGIP